MVQYYDGPDSKGIQNTSFPILWQTADGKPPPNEPFCGFRGDKIQCRNSKGIYKVPTFQACPDKITTFGIWVTF